MEHLEQTGVSGIVKKKIKGPETGKIVPGRDLGGIKGREGIKGEYNKNYIVCMYEVQNLIT